ncbi:MAG: acyl-CoA synthetase [Desulfarculus sp.]|nr:acyl-CoA synthetase [Pseudomonadota bacterium]MBU4596956.1 acyl-CoA synthetase [Pseudomonadota bacterium]MBV1714293.1 acyl-CoA synthetase [Desulfarculus sp.]MBV1737651.1 acyl-CoA synthetase [Desulfarculus sp.]
MSTIPENYLPIPENLPDKIYPLPEVRLPYLLNPCQYFLDRHIEQGRGEQVAIIHRQRLITFNEFRSEVNRLANALAARGIAKYDRVMVRMPNRPEFIITCFACWRLGAIPVLTHHLLQSKDIAFRANDSDAKAIVVSADTFGPVREALNRCPTLKTVVVTQEPMDGHLFYDDFIADQLEESATVETTRKDWLRIIYSSGTTGNPKGIISEIGDMVAGIRVANKYLLKLKPDEVLGSPPAFTFAFGFFSILFFGESGCTLCIREDFDPEAMFQEIQDRRINVLRCVPTGLRMMLEMADAEKRWNLSSLRLCQSAGEVLPATVVKKWKDRFGVYILNSMGSAELNSYISTREQMPEDKMGSLGTALPSVDYRIVGEDLQEVPPGSLGELVVRAPWGQVYWRRPEVQEKNVVNGWNRTGLMFQVDDDGYFWLKGRSDDMIVSSGYKIPGGEVEEALLSHPAVHEAAVVPSPEPIRGFLVKAFVVLKEEHPDPEALAEELKDHVKSTIEPYKYPRVIEFVRGDELPRTTTGKIQRFILREREAQQNSPE